MAMINMQTMRYINLLYKIARVKTSKCFIYNNTIIFVVPEFMMRQAIGDGGRNVREMYSTLGKRVRIIRDIENDNAEVFIKEVIEPLTFRSLEVKDKEVILNAGPNYKASLFGRNKRRFEELKQIVEDNFGKELRIV